MLRYVQIEIVLIVFFMYYFDRVAFFKKKQKKKTQSFWRNEYRLKCLCVPAWVWCNNYIGMCFAESFSTLSLHFNVFDFCTSTDGRGDVALILAQMRATELEREHKQRQRERERERKPSLFNPFHSCRGKVWLPQLECINKSAFSFPFKTTPITTLTQVTVCIFLIWFIYYWISVEYRQWHRLCKVTLITFDCMWGFLMEARSEMCPCSTPTVASYPT